jgi:hypothetical protein
VAQREVVERSEPAKDRLRSVDRRSRLTRCLTFNRQPYSTCLTIRCHASLSPVGRLAPREGCPPAIGRPSQVARISPMEPPRGVPVSNPPRLRDFSKVLRPQLLPFAPADRRQTAGRAGAAAGARPSRPSRRRERPRQGRLEASKGSSHSTEPGTEPGTRHRARRRTGHLVS